MTSSGILNNTEVPTFLFFSFSFKFLSLKPISLPRFWRAIDSFANVLIIYSFGTSIRARAIKIGICNLVTLFGSVNASSNWFVTSYKWIIFWISSSHWFVWELKWDNKDAFHKSSHFFKFFSPPNPGKYYYIKLTINKPCCKNISS